MYKRIMFALFTKQKKKKNPSTIEWLNKLHNEIFK